MLKFYHRRLSFFNKINLTIYLRFLRFYKDATFKNEALAVLA